MSGLYKTSLKITAVIAISIILGLSWLYINMSISLTVDKPIVIDFKRGSTIRTLANVLVDKKLLSNKTKLVVWAKISRQTTRLQAGEYLLEDGMSINGLLGNMVEGRSRQYGLTIIEGWMFKQMLEAIRLNAELVHTLKDYKIKSVMNTLGYSERHPEGLFFPDTFYFTKGTTDVEVLKRSFDYMDNLLESEWQSRDKNLPFKNKYEALILASIVEKESAVAAERPVIAGVFVNRLRKRMRLQTDPTVIYGMGDAYDGDIRFRDLRRDTPYNTYTRAGLPPTPIALPGEGAIKAVMHPADTEYLFFVAHSDGSGNHIFTKTVSAHEKQVDIHQRKKKKRKKRK